MAKTERLGIRLTAVDADALESRANRLGMTKTAYLTHLIRLDPKPADPDDLYIPDGVSRDAFPLVTSGEATALLDELRRQGAGIESAAKTLGSISARAGEIDGVDMNVYVPGILAALDDVAEGYSAVAPKVRELCFRAIRGN